LSHFGFELSWVDSLLIHFGFELSWVDSLWVTLGLSWFMIQNQLKGTSFLALI
jgi:hypothetical protein